MVFSSATIFIIPMISFVLILFIMLYKALIYTLKNLYTICIFVCTSKVGIVFVVRKRSSSLLACKSSKTQCTCSRDRVSRSTNCKHSKSFIPFLLSRFFNSSRHGFFPSIHAPNLAKSV